MFFDLQCIWDIFGTKVFFHFIFFALIVILLVLF